jgi:hypothetical protein
MKTAILLICFAAAMPAQLLEGTVYDALTGVPLPGVVIATNAFSQGPTARTDASGHFRMPVPPNHSSQLTAEKAGYLEPVDTIPDWNSQTMRIQLNPEAIVTGKVQDEDGFPAGGSRVYAVHYRVLNGERTLFVYAAGETDEQGNYRIDNLTAGRYYIRVDSRDASNWDPRYLPQYLGGTLQPDDGHMVEVKYGETLQNVDVRLARYEGVTVSGRIEGVTANPRGSGYVVTLAGEMAGNTYQTYGAEPAFAMRHVPPGTYKLRYGRGNPSPGDLFAQLKVEVGDRDVSGLVITPHVVQPADVEGQVVVREGGSPEPWMVSLHKPFGSGVGAHTNEDGSFVVKGLLPEHYLVQLIADKNALQGKTAASGYIASAMLGDLDVREKGFDLDGPPQKLLRITVSTQYANIGGSVVDSQGAPVANTTVFFRSNAPVRLGSAVTDDKGRFHATLTEGGDFHVYTSADQSMMAAQGEDEYLQAHPGDFPLIHVALGDNPPLSLVRNARLAQ